MNGVKDTIKNFIRNISIMTDEDRIRQILYYCLSIPSTKDDWTPFWSIFWDRMNSRKLLSESLLREIIDVVSLRLVLQRYCKDKLSIDFIREFDL